MKKLILIFCVCLSTATLSAQITTEIIPEGSDYKNMVFAGYDPISHLLGETLLEAFENQCDDENGCDQFHFDYGMIKIGYERIINEKFNVGIYANLAATYQTEYGDEQLINNSVKFITVPIFCRYKYVETENFTLSSSLGLKPIFILRTNQITHETFLNVAPSLHAQFINATWTVGKEFKPFISVGLGSSMVNLGLSYNW